MKKPKETNSNNQTESPPVFMTSCFPVKNAMTENEAPYTDPEALLQARVLKILKPCRAYWLDEQTLYMTLNLSRPAVTRVRLESALRELRDKAYVDFRVDPLSRLTEWRLTPSGHALAQPL
jgi:hypothetical protein